MPHYVLQLVGSSVLGSPRVFDVMMLDLKAQRDEKYNDVLLLSHDHVLPINCADNACHLAD